MSIFALIRRQGERRFGIQLSAALLMGVAICGMHYTGMAAASFPVGSVCRSADALSGSGLTGLVVVASLLLLGKDVIDINQLHAVANANRSTSFPTPLNNVLITYVLAVVGGLLLGLGITLPRRRAQA